MATPTIRGSLLAQIQSQEFEFDPTRGITQLTDWRAVGYQDVISRANLAAANGISYRLKLEKGIGSLSTNDATLNNSIDNWELIGSDERLDLFQHPTLLTYWSLGDQSFQTQNIGYLRQAVETNLETAAVVAAFVGAGWPQIDANTIGEFYGLYQRGITEFENDAYGGGYTLRHSTNAPNRWTTNIADFNVGLVYSTAHLLTEATNSSLWVFPLPANLQFAINSIPIPSAQTGFFWGWKKQRSTRETVANNRIQITQNYILELWSTLIYGTF